MNDGDQIVSAVVPWRQPDRRGFSIYSETSAVQKLCWHGRRREAQGTPAAGPQGRTHYNSITSRWWIARCAMSAAPERASNALINCQCPGNSFWGLGRRPRCGRREWLGGGATRLAWASLAIQFRFPVENRRT